MGGLQTARGLDGDVECFVQLERTLCKFGLDGSAFEKCHGQKGPPVGFVDFVDGADIGVIEGRGCLRLAKETPSVLVVFDGLRSKEFQGDGTLELGVLSLVDHTHTALAELLGDFVVGDGVADHYLGESVSRNPEHS